MSAALARDAEIDVLVVRIARLQLRGERFAVVEHHPVGDAVTGNKNLRRGLYEWKGHPLAVLVRRQMDPAEPVAVKESLQLRRQLPRRVVKIGHLVKRGEHV